jgi:vancomycin resistance protein YoaR
MGEQTGKKKGKAARFLVTLVVLLIVAAAGAGIYAYTVLNQDTFFTGVYVDDINLDGLTYQRAIDAITANKQPMLDEIHIQLTDGERVWDFGAEDIHARINVEEVLEAAWAVGREGSIFQRLAEINAAKTEPVSFYTDITYDVAELRDELEAIAEEVYVQPVDATITFHQGEEDPFTITPEQVGRELLVDETIAQLMERVDNRQYGEMDLPVQELPPQYYESELKTWTTKIASYRTLVTEDADRTHNIKLSSEAYDGLVLQPGEIFSLNEATGPRDKAHGYRDADVIVGGIKLEPAPGGGNCQTSTTLYGAAVRADLEIVERYPHSFPSSYTKVGQDATVNYPYADIKIRNNKDTPLFFDRYFDGDWICVDIYGKAPTEYDHIDLETVILEQRPTPEPTMVADANLPVGAKVVEYKSRPYIKCETYRVYYNKNGEEIKRVFEDTSVYRQVVGLTRVGTRMPDGTVVSLEQALNLTASAPAEP